MCIRAVAQSDQGLLCPLIELFGTIRYNEYNNTLIRVYVSLIWTCSKTSFSHGGFRDHRVPGSDAQQFKESELSRRTFSSRLHMRPARTQITDCVFAQSDESSQRTLWVAKDLKCRQANSTG